MGSTSASNAPDDNYFKTFSINRIKQNSDCFCYGGKLDCIYCNFKIDTDSNVFILNKKFVKEEKERINVEDCKLRYPSGRRVSIEFQVEVEVQLRKYLIKIPMFVAKINDNCLLGAYFLKR